MLPALLAVALSTLAADDFTSLFDGKTLAGWSNPYTWGKAEAINGEIHLTADKKFFLVTDKRYGDFILEGEVLVPDGPANSGFMLRAHVAPNKVTGFQAEVDPSPRRWAGGLYDEGRRGWLRPLDGNPTAQAAFDRTKWNAYRIECIGDSIKIFVNGVLTCDYLDPMDLDGPLAIQHHGEKGATYRFRNLKVRDLGRHEWRPLFDGSTLAGWHAKPGGTWSVRNKMIVGSASASEPRHGLLVSDREFGDVTIRVEFRSVKGNSGLYFRSREVEDAVGVYGFQAEIDPSHDVGGLYETGGRGWVVQPKPEQVATWLNKPDAWNVMTVSARGGHVVVHVNGHRTAELFDDPGAKSGKIALQMHGGQEMEVEFRKVEILEPAGAR